MKSKKTRFEEEARVATDLWLPFVRQYGIASIFLPVAGIYDSHIAEVAFDTMPIRVLMCIAVISMCTHKHWSREWQDSAHFVWSAVVIFTLPFGFGVMLTQAAANAPLGTEVHYMMSEAYRPGLGDGVRFDDPKFGISWPLPVARISERDGSYPDFDAALHAQRFARAVAGGGHAA